MKIPFRFLSYGTTFLVGFAFCYGLTHLGPLRNGIFQERQNPKMQRLHALGLAMFSYANDNGGNYPDGKSSTEAFQKLIDGGYVPDPALFYLPTEGKTKPIAGQKLKPENICFDVTSGATLHSPGELPVVFFTGFRVSYAPGGSALPVIKPYPRFGGDRVRTWTEWWYGRPPDRPMGPGIAAFLVSGIVWFTKLETAPDGTGSIPNFVPPDFKPDGKTYRQLTPDGPLP